MPKPAGRNCSAAELARMSWTPLVSAAAMWMRNISTHAMQPRKGYDTNQFAQRVINTPGKQDGLAWQNANGTWSGPVGEKIARVRKGMSAAPGPTTATFSRS
jgi:hypothetical protein